MTFTTDDVDAGVARLNTPRAFTKQQKEELRAFVARIEHVEGELADGQEAKSEIYEEVEEKGFDKKTVKAVVKARKKSRLEREEEQEKFEFYMNVVGDA